MELPQFDTMNAPINLNFSILQDFFDCPYRFKISFFYGFVQPIVPGLGYGTSMHEVVMNIHRRFISGVPVEKEELPGIVNEHFFLRYAPAYIEENMHNKARDSIVDYYDKEKDEFKNIQHAETDIEVDLGDNIKVNGRIDLVKRKDMDGSVKTFIVDFKTSHGDISECINAEQLKIYAMGYKELCGEQADYMEVCNLDNCQYEREPVTEKTIDEVKVRIKSVATHIRANRLERKCEKIKCTSCYLRDLCLSKKEKSEMKIIT
jgi:DNA helicase-2/ATP-dependent DNA helicase PcrA